MAINDVGPTRRVVDFALGLRYEAFAPAVVDRTKQLFLDFLGVALGGRALAPSSAPLMKAVSGLAGKTPGSCTVIGGPERYLPQYAALLNAALAHSMDFDDTHREAIMHLGAPLFAALLAVGELESCSGLDFLGAAAAGYEIGAKLGRAHGDRIHLRGFHPTATTGIFAVSAAAGRLLGLDQATVESALGLDLSMAAGSQQFAESGGGIKPLQVGMAAHNALYALALAREGYPGAGRPLEGSFGYYATYGEPGSDLDKISFDLESPVEVLGVGIKPYPCCRYSHGTIDGVLAIAVREGLSPDEIESIVVDLPPAGFRLVGARPELKRRPASIVEAQFSLYFAAAVAAASRSYTWDSYARLNDPQLQRLMDLTEVRPEAGLTEMETRLAIASGRGSWSLHVPLPKGEPETPLSWDEVEDKFLDLGSRVLGRGRCKEVATTVHELERVRHFSELAHLLRPVA